MTGNELQLHPPPATALERLDMRVAVVALATAFYAITFLPLHAQLGPGVVSLAVVPVALAGWLFGLRAGLLAGALAFPANTVLLGVEEAELVRVVWGGAISGSAALMVGAVAGTLRDMADSLARQLNSHQGVDAAVQKAEYGLRQLVQSAPAFLMTVAPDGTVSYVNHEVAGLDPDQVRGASVYNFVPRQHHDLFRSALAKTCQTGKETGYEVADGMEGDVPTLHVIRMAPVREGGRVSGATVLSIDVTPPAPARY
jgi:PAS domain S-box-containing protein